MRVSDLIFSRTTCAENQETRDDPFQWLHRLSLNGTAQTVRNGQASLTQSDGSGLVSVRLLDTTGRRLLSGGFPSGFDSELFPV